MSVDCSILNGIPTNVIIRNRRLFHVDLFGENNISYKINILREANYCFNVTTMQTNHQSINDISVYIFIHENRRHKYLCLNIKYRKGNCKRKYFDDWLPQAETNEALNFFANKKCKQLWIFMLRIRLGSTVERNTHIVRGV